MPHRFTRQELYDLVWEQPRSTLSKRYGVSDVALAKACRRAGIPMPDRGYWAKRQAGRRTIRAAMPPRAPGAADAITVGGEGRWGYPLSYDEHDYEPIPPAPNFSESIDEVAQRIRKAVGIVRLSRSLQKPHPQIAQFLEEDERRRQKHQTSPYSWNEPQFDSAFERRRLRILNSIFLALVRLGSKATMRGEKARDLSVRVGDQYVSFAVDRPTMGAGSRQRTKNDAQPNQMRLEISGSSAPGLRLVWEDAPEASLADHLSEIVVSLLVAGELEYRESLEHHYKWRLKRKTEREEEARQQKAEVERLERERRRKAAQAKVDRLLADAAAWRQAAEVRVFIAAVRSKHAQDLDSPRAKELEEWAHWALSQAEQLDPLNRSELSPPVPAYTETPSDGA